MKHIIWKILAIFAGAAILQIGMAALGVSPENREALSFAVGGGLGYALGGCNERRGKKGAANA